MSAFKGIMNLIWEQNSKIVPQLNKNTEFVKSSVEKYMSLGLSYIENDYYVYIGKGGLKIHETPKGVRKHISKIAHKYELSVIVSEGIICEGDKISVVSDGTIETISIEKNSKSLIMGSIILAPYAVVSVFKDNVMITRKLFIVPNNEYLEIVKMGTGNKFKTLMAQKMVMKRVLNGIFSLLGVTLNREDTEEIDRMAEDMRVDSDPTPKENIKTEKSIDLSTIKKEVDVLDIDSLSKYIVEVGILISKELDKAKIEELKLYGNGLKALKVALKKGVADELSTNSSK